jgi:hypothetical protein
VYYNALEAIGHYFHMHKRNMGPMLDEKSYKIYSYADWKKKNAQTSGFIDGLKFTGGT